MGMLENTYRKGGAGGLFIAYCFGYLAPFEAGLAELDLNSGLFWKAFLVGLLGTIFVGINYTACYKKIIKYFKQRKSDKEI